MRVLPLATCCYQLAYFYPGSSSMIDSQTSHDPGQPHNEHAHWLQAHLNLLSTISVRRASLAPAAHNFGSHCTLCVASAVMLQAEAAAVGLRCCMWQRREPCRCCWWSPRKQGIWVLPATCCSTLDSTRTAKDPHYSTQAAL